MCRCRISIEPGLDAGRRSCLGCCNNVKCKSVSIHIPAIHSIQSGFYIQLGRESAQTNRMQQLAELGMQLFLRFVLHLHTLKLLHFEQCVVFSSRLVKSSWSIYASGISMSVSVSMDIVLNTFRTAIMYPVLFSDLPMCIFGKPSKFPWQH